MDDFVCCSLSVFLAMSEYLSFSLDKCFRTFGHTNCWIQKFIYYNSSIFIDSSLFFHFFFDNLLSITYINKNFRPHFHIQRVQRHVVARHRQALLSDKPSVVFLSITGKLISKLKWREINNVFSWDILGATSHHISCV